MSTPLTFITCESTAAITLHVRIVLGTTPANYSGHSPRIKALCGGVVAWDTKLPIGAARCTKCIEVMKNMVTEGLRGG